MKKRYLFLGLLFLIIVLLNPTSVKASTTQVDDQQEESENSPTTTSEPTLTPSPTITPTPTVTLTPTAAYSFLDEGAFTILIEEPNILNIKNDSEYEFSIELELSNFYFLPFDEDSNKKFDVNEILHISDLNNATLPNNTYEINVNELVSFIIKVDEEELKEIKPGTYTGYVKVIDVKTDKYLEKKISIEIPVGRVTSIELPQVDWATTATCKKAWSKNPECEVKEPYFFITGNDIEEYSWLKGETIGYLEDKLSNVVEVKVKSVDFEGRPIENMDQSNQEEDQPTSTVTSTKDESEQAENEERLIRVDLAIDDISTHGTFTGSLDVYKKFDLPEEESKNISYSVTSKHWFIYPLCVYILSIVAAMWIESWFGKTRKIRLLKLRVRETEKIFNKLYKDSTEKFPNYLKDYYEQIKKLLKIKCKNNKQEVNDEDDANYCKIKNNDDQEFNSEDILNKIHLYNIETDFNDCAKKLLGDIRSLRKLGFGKFTGENDQFSKIVNSVEALEASLVNWGNLGEKYVKLFDELVKFFIELESNNKERPDWSKRKGFNYPVFYHNAINLLIKPTNETVEVNKKKVDRVKFEIGELGRTNNDVNEIIALLKKWHDMEKEIQFFLTYLNKFRPFNQHPDSVNKALFSVEKIINQAWGELWICEDPAQMKERLTEKDIDQAEEKLLELSSYIPKSQRISLFWIGDREKKGIIKEFFTKTVERLKEIDIEQIIPPALKASIQVGDWISLFITFSVGAITAYGTLYHQKPFGSFYDYTLVVTTAFASQVLISFLGDGIRKMRFLTME